LPLAVETGIKAVANFAVKENGKVIAVVEFADTNIKYEHDDCSKDILFILNEKSETNYNDLTTNSKENFQKSNNICHSCRDEHDEIYNIESK